MPLATSAAGQVDPERGTGTAEWPASVPRGMRIAAESSPSSAEAVLSRFLAAHSALRYDEALMHAQELVAVAPEHALSHYNLACVHARRRDIGPALEALHHAVDRGWRNVAHARLDPDLTALRRMDGFQEALERMRVLEQEERLEPRPLRQDSIEQLQLEFEAEAPAVLDRYHVPGAAVAVVRSGEPVWQAALGVADRSTGLPIDAETTWLLDAPIDLLAIVATAQLDQADRLDLAGLLMAAQERAETAVLATRAAPGLDDRPGSRAVGFRPRQAGAERRVAPRLGPFSGAETREVLWAGLDLVGSGFTTHVRRHVLGRLRLERTRLGPGPDLPASVGSGHSPLGTPLPLPASLPESSVVTSVTDLAQLAAALATLEEPGPLGTGVASTVDAAASFGLDRLGLAVSERENGGGRCVEVTDAAAGVTLLMRWYPATGDAVVVIANSADASAAAERLAQIVLGG